MPKKTLTAKQTMDRFRDQKEIIGREKEIEIVLTLLTAGQNLLIEGPVGVGKTYLLQKICEVRKTPVYRIDGDARFTEQKLTGWFDPPSVLKKGYTSSSFVPGPLHKAMKEGAVLFINELNRLPEGVQNILLPVLDEGILQIPHLKPLEAKPGFMVIATMNPREFVATTHISEALLDRFELLFLDYQSVREELSIVEHKLKGATKKDIKDAANLIGSAVSITRSTRENKYIKRGASIRAAIAIVEYVVANLKLHNKNEWTATLFSEACQIVLPNRIELSDDGVDLGFAKVIDELLEDLQKKN